MQSMNLSPGERRDVQSTTQGRWDYSSVAEGLHQLYGEHEDGKGRWHGAHSAGMNGEWGGELIDADIGALQAEFCNALMEALEITTAQDGWQGERCGGGDNPRRL